MFFTCDYLIIVHVNSHFYLEHYFGTLCHRLSSITSLSWWMDTEPILENTPWLRCQGILHTDIFMHPLVAKLLTY